MNKLSRIISLIALSTIIISTLPKAEPLSSSAPKECILKDGPVTIFLHGTTIPLISRMMGQCESIEGLCHISEAKSCYKTVGSRLHMADPENFNTDSLYMFCWSGLLSHKERKKIAKSLYLVIKNHKGPITFIGHSHGCNVILHVAAIAAKAKNSDLKIELTILLAPPVQEATAQFIGLSVFKKVISCYSKGDILQVMDPQKLTSSSENQSPVSRSPKGTSPFFSERRFAPYPHLKQIEILIDMQSPGHSSFLETPFLNRLPSILKFVEENAEKNIDTIILNIPNGPGNEIQVQPFLPTK